jgi:exodeoxyribonuclease VII large subunit
MTTDNTQQSVSLPALSVSDLAQQLKRTLEQKFDYVRVRGELSRVTRHSSGHIYTDLKDANAVINSVCWKGVAANLKVQPAEGLDVICTGRISTYPQRSNYQLIIDSMELAGEGALLKMLEERKQRLRAEGLFAPERKKALPFMPQRIGVITSPTGAVIRDILHRVTDRFPTHVLVWPVTVQGEGAAQNVIKALQGFHNATGAQRPDVIIVARGGGSVEDLMPFNDEDLVRAIADCTIPIITAVGHETDTTLVDYVADRRAPTPTAAAEMALPVKEDLRYTVQNHFHRIDQHIRGYMRHYKAELRTLEARLGDPQRALNAIQQRLDLAGSYAQRAMMQLLHRYRQILQRVPIQLYNPQNRLQQQQQSLNHVTQRLQRVTQIMVQQKTQQLQHRGALLDSYSFHKTLERGFALVRGADGQAITQAAQAQKQPQLDIQFADGVVKTTPQ